MKRITLLLPLFLALPACKEAPHVQQHSRMNTWMVDTHHRDMADAAIVAQRTVFPHHFVDPTAKLNARGEKNLRVLAAHFKHYPGTLNVRRGETPEALYQQRLAAVRAFLTAGGVPPESVTLADGFSGGDGIASEQWREPPPSGEPAAPPAEQ